MESGAEKLPAKISHTVSHSLGLQASVPVDLFVTLDSKFSSARNAEFIIAVLIFPKKISVSCPYVTWYLSVGWSGIDAPDTLAHNLTRFCSTNFPV